MYILAADIGATTSRVRLCTAMASGRWMTVAEQQSLSGNARQIKNTIRAFVRENLPRAVPKLAAAALGLPGKISTDRQSCAVSYLDPSRYVSFKDLFEDIAAVQGALLNDLECGVLAVKLLRDADLELLCGEAADEEGRAGRFILGMPGSGLGVGLALGPETSIPSEGGNALAAIDCSDGIETMIARFVLRKCGNVGVPTYQDLLRGAAIPLIFESLVFEEADSAKRTAILADLEARATMDRRPLVIEAWAFAENSMAHGVACETFRYYGRFLGRMMQSVALTVLPGAAYLGGSVVNATHPLFRESFIASFRQHPQHGAFLANLPVYVVSSPQLNLDGATRTAVRIALSGTPEGW